MPADDYFKFLLAFAGVRKVIEFLGVVTKKTKNVNSTTENGINWKRAGQITFGLF
jgi:hypothetical protein